MQEIKFVDSELNTRRELYKWLQITKTGCQREWFWGLRWQVRPLRSLVIRRFGTSGWEKMRMQIIKFDDFSVLPLLNEPEGWASQSISFSAPLMQAALYFTWDASIPNALRISFCVFVTAWYPDTPVPCASSLWTCGQMQGSYASTSSGYYSNVSV